MKYIRTFLAALTLIAFATIPLAPAVGAGQSETSILGDACNKNPNSPICQQSNSANSRTSDFIQSVINLLLYVIGVIAVVMIIIGGIKYTLSNGDSNQITSAKNTILYAVIGLVVALLAFAIVNFIIARFVDF